MLQILQSLPVHLVLAGGLIKQNATSFLSSPYQISKCRPASVDTLHFNALLGL